jgi:putative tricarboxylic transport membrane protein
MKGRVTVLAGLSISGLLLAGCSTSSGSQQDGPFEAGDVTMVVPFGPGGGSDASGRAVAAGLEEASGANISVENREGGSGAVGYSYFLGKQGDGNTLLATETALLALPLTQQVEFDYTSFTPIMKVGDDYTLLVVPADADYETCADVVEAAKSERVVAGISGATSLDNVVFTLVEQEMGVEFDRVPFESGSELVAALLGDQIQVASLNPTEVVGQLESGDLKALCAFSEERYDYEQLADIPTAKEQGIDVAFAQFRGLLAPGGISDSAKDYWVKAAKDFEKSDAYTAYVEDNFMQPAPEYGDDFTAYLDANNTELEKAIGRWPT